jgi:hypothetical protein
VAFSATRRAAGLTVCSAGTASAGRRLRAARHSSKRWTMTKNDGTNKTARQVDAIMPVNTAMPIDLRALAPAPVATTRGAPPRMKANDVMMSGRNRDFAPATAASAMDMPLARISRANSTIRMAFFADNAISRMRPIWT